MTLSTPIGENEVMQTEQKAKSRSFTASSDPAKLLSDITNHIQKHDQSTGFKVRVYLIDPIKQLYRVNWWTDSNKILKSKVYQHVGEDEYGPNLKDVTITKSAASRH